MSKHVPLVPVLVLLDFTSGRWARYAGKRRTLGGDLAPEAAGAMRTLDWSHALYQVRYTPWELDADHLRT